MSWQGWTAYGLGVLAALLVTTAQVAFAFHLMVAVGCAALLWGIWRSVNERPDAMIREIFTVMALSIFVLALWAWKDPSIVGVLPPPTPACPALERIPGDCTQAVDIAVVATEERCSELLDCRNAGLHPDRCSHDCKYCALRHALDLDTLP